MDRSLGQVLSSQIGDCLDWSKSSLDWRLDLWFGERFEESEEVGQESIHIWLKGFVEIKNVFNLEMEGVIGKAVGTEVPEIKVR